ncbi:MAG: hypothetical protein WAS36_02965 [Candidatus Saccharimonadales bacterium]
MATPEQVGPSTVREQRAAAFLADMTLRVARTSPDDTTNLSVQAEVAALIEQAAAQRGLDAVASLPEISSQKDLQQ